MATIFRPCYATREDVMRAMDVKLASYNMSRIDRAIQSGAESVDDLCKRVFFFADDTRSWDWPNYQYAYPWRVWFDKSELADTTVNVPVVVSGGVLIDPSTILWGDPQYPDPPFTYLELDRSSNSAFGNGPTPQREISIAGTYGYWTKTLFACDLAQSVAVPDRTILVNDGATPGVGDVAIIDDERMLVTGAHFIDVSIQPVSGCTTAKASDNTMVVPDGTKFSEDETILLDSEWMLVEAILGNKLIVKRAWGGSVLAEHSDPDIWARRQLDVDRGALGTTAATHAMSASVFTSMPPGMVKQLNVAEALVSLGSEPTAYAGTTTGTRSSVINTGIGGTGRSAVRELLPGVGIQGLRDQVAAAYGRQARSRVV